MCYLLIPYLFTALFKNFFGKNADIDNRIRAILFYAVMCYLYPSIAGIASIGIFCIELKAVGRVLFEIIWELILRRFRVKKLLIENTLDI
ncbi:hypothetical protein DMU16_24045 [Salmonella enterica]|nr:hypothetical protein [Salmonella enterica]